MLWFNENLTKAEANQPSLYKKLNDNKTKFAANTYTKKAMTEVVNSPYKKGYFRIPGADQRLRQCRVSNGRREVRDDDQYAHRTAGDHKPFPNVQASSFGYFPIPILDNQLLPTHPAAPTNFVYSKGSHIAQAKQFLEFLAQPANLQYLVDNEVTRRS